jgi:hypothetical protein
MMKTVPASKNSEINAKEPWLQTHDTLGSHLEAFLSPRFLQRFKNKKSSHKILRFGCTEVQFTKSLLVHFQLELKEALPMTLINKFHPNRKLNCRNQMKVSYFEP